MRIKIYFGISFIFLSVLPLKGNTDSLLNKINGNSFDIRYSNQDSSLILAKKAYMIASENGNLFEVMRSLNNIANHYRINKNYKKAISLFSEGIKVGEELGDTLFLAKIFSNIGLTYKSAGIYDSAIINFHRSLQLSSDIHGNAHTLHNLGITHRLLGDYENALNYFEKSYQLYKLKHDSLNMARAFNAKGTVYFEEEKYDKALTYFKKYLRNIPPNYKYKISIAYGNIGTAYEALNKLDSALSFIYKSLIICREINDNIGVIINLTNAANVLVKQNKNLAAIKLYKQALSMADSLNSPGEKVDILLAISDSYRNLKQYKQSLNYFEKYCALDDSLLNESTKSLIVKEQEKYNAAERKNEIIQLRSEKKEKERYQQLLTYIIISIVAIGVISSLFVYILYRNKRKRKQAEHQKEVTYAMLDAEEAERERISQEIHDNLGAKLSLIRMYFSNVKKDVPKEVHQPLEDIILQTIDNTSEISHKLFASELKDLGLVPALNEMFSTLNKLNDVPDFVFSTNIEGDRRLEWTTELNLYRIVQELVNNTLKYAEASSVSLKLVHKNSEITLQYNDNGKGFDLKKVKKGVGLESIKNRANRINYTAHFHTKPGQGVEVIISS